MDISSIQAFITISETGSFSRAAEKLHITQPAISKRIASLEKQLNAKLFDRIGRNIHLTEAGQVLLPKVINMINELEEGRALISNLSGKVQGPLRMATSHHIGLHRLPPVLRKFKRSYPEVTLDLHFMDSEDACRLIEKGDLELGVVTLPNQPFPHLETTLIWDDPLVIVSSTEHPLQQQKRIKLSDLADHEAVLPGKETFTRDLIEQLFDSHGLNPRIALETNYLETLKTMAAVGLGWSILPSIMLDHELNELNVVGVKPIRSLGMIQHHKRSLSNAANAMRHLLLDSRNYSLPTAARSIESAEPRPR